MQGFVGEWDREGTGRLASSSLHGFLGGAPGTPIRRLVRAAEAPAPSNERRHEDVDP
jgi:hypothetical protein